MTTTTRNVLIFSLTAALGLLLALVATSETATAAGRALVACSILQIVFAIRAR